MNIFRAGIPESGILRKHKILKENLDDLLVFGYACKLFRDDEKALYIDQGKHLIPWMGDEALRIDRYDGRGTLSDIKSCEANREDYDTTRWLGLNESERRVEQLCDEERYYSLTSNEEEELLYKEEELKRQKANEFQYNYDESPKIDDDTNSQSSIPTVEQDDRPYVPRPELDVPVDISIPKTIKENVRIEKTAMFVSQQGLQMEILIKAKQANNLQFNFMNQADPLYKYFRHVVAAFKSGRYTLTEYGNTDDTSTTTAPSTQDPSTSTTDLQLSTADDRYLHLTLTTANSQPSIHPLHALDPASSVQQLADQMLQAPTIAPTLSYRPRADCAYTQLISRIKGAQQLYKEQQDGSDKSGDAEQPVQGVAVQQQPQEGPPATGGGALTAEQQQQYFQYYYTLRYYDGYKVLGEQYTAQGMDPQPLLQNTSIQEQIQQQASQYAQAALTAYMAQIANTPNTAAVSTVAAVQGSPVLQTMEQTQSVVQTVSQVQGVVQTNASAFAQTVKLVQPAEVKKTVNPLLTLAHYGSDSDEEEDEQEEKERENSKKGEKVKHSDEVDRKAVTNQLNHSESLGYMIPPEDISVIIDKMAAYVSKNGGDFENIVKSRGDSRFEFLKSEHEYNSYYKHNLRKYLGTSGTSTKTDNDNEEPQKTANDKNTSEMKIPNGSVTMQENVAETVEKKLPVPVSFSIKAREESQIEIKPSALPMEESSDEEEEESTVTKSDNKPEAKVANTINSGEIDSSKSNNITTSMKTAAILKDIPLLNSNSLVTSIVASINKTRNLAAESKEGKDGVVLDAVEVWKKKERMEKTVSESEEDDPLMEMIDLTNDLDDKNEHLNKPTKSSHDQQQRALQLERRRKAAAFLRLRSMMDVYKTIENQIDVKDKDKPKSNDTKTTTTTIATTISTPTTTKNATKNQGTCNSSKESTPRLGRAKEKEGGDGRVRRLSTQSRSSDVVEIIDDSEEEIDKAKEVKKELTQKKKSHKKKSHKRKHSKSSRSRNDGNSSPPSRHKSKKRRKQSSSSRSKSKVNRSRSRTRSSSRST